MSQPRALVVPAVLALAWLLLSIPYGLTGLDLLAGLAAAGAGVMAAVIWPRLHQGAGRALAAADDLLGEGGDQALEAVAAAEGEEGAEGAEGDPEQLDETVPPGVVEAVLERLAERLDATRLVVWRADPGSAEIAPEHAWCPPPVRVPGAVAVAGSPLAWALRERSPLRLDPAPRWARGLAALAPVDDRRVLSVETPLEQPASEEELRAAGELLAPVLRLYDQQAHAAAATRRLDRVIDFLRSVPGEADPADMPVALARAAVEIGGGSGALVAAWSGEQGTVLARAGADGGPVPGTAFGVMEGDLAHAARTGSSLPRAPGGPPWPALASASERWERPPPAYRTVIPLVDPRAETTGLLTIWGRTAPSTQGVALLQAISPLLALQLRQAGDLEHFRERATIDALTGLPNRAALDDRMAEERARFHRYRRPLSLLVVDLDYFKRINDRYGHDAGDAVLRRVGDVLRAVVRDVDVAARFGGEELVVLLPETMLAPALDAAERIRAAVASAAVRFGDETTPIAVTASIGVSSCPECVDDPDGLFAAADQALYASKEAGRNRVTAAPVRVPSGGAGGGARSGMGG